QLQQFQQLRYRCDFIRLCVDCHLPQREPRLARPGTDHMQRLQLPALTPCPLQRFPIPMKPLPRHSRCSCNHGSTTAWSVAAGSTANPRVTVSCDGIPCGNSRHVCKKSSWTLPQVALCTKSSQPANTPQNLSIMTSTSGCLRLAHGSGDRGSPVTALPGHMS